MPERLSEADVTEIFRAARRHGTVTVALRIWTNAEVIVIQAPRWLGRAYRVQTRAFSDDPVWNPPDTVRSQELTEPELTEYLLSRSLELEYVQAGSRILFGADEK